MTAEERDGQDSRHPTRAPSQAVRDHKIELLLDEKAKDWLADKGWDPAYGARPLKSVIQRYVQDPLAEMLLAGDVRDDSTAKISSGKDGLTFNGKSRRPWTKTKMI